MSTTTDAPVGDQGTALPRSVLLTPAQEARIHQLRIRRGMPSFASVMREAVELLLEREGVPAPVDEATS